MHKNIGFFVTLGGVIFLVLVSSMLGGQKKAAAEPLTYSFTYTSPETVKVVTVCDTVIQFHAFLTNTGTSADSYTVTLIENPPTPSPWWVRYCVNWVCYDSTITQVKISLEPAEVSPIDLDIKPRIAGEGNITITVENKGSLKVVKSKTFLLSAHSQGPVTNQWGLIILILLLIASGMYLMFRRYRTVRQT